MKCEANDVKLQYPLQEIIYNIQSSDQIDFTHHWMQIILLCFFFSGTAMFNIEQLLILFFKI